MPNKLHVVSACLVLAGGAAPAQATWSPMVGSRDSASPSSVAVAVDARGDAAVAWVASTGARSGATAVRVATRDGRRGVWSTHVLRSARGLRAGGLTLVIAPNGEATVAWIDELRSRNRTVRAAFRMPRRRWTAIQAVGALSPFAYAYPRMAVAPNGTVALVYNAHNRAARGMAFSWRRAGHRFSPVRAVPGGVLSEPTLTIDARGAAVLAGTALCDDEQRSHGVLLTAPARTHRFGAPRTITPHPATQVRFVSTAPGRGIVAWIGAGCSTTELLSGSVSAARVDSSGVHNPVTLESSFGGGLQMLAGPDGVDLSWTSWAPATPAGAVLAAQGHADGSFGQPHQPADGWLPIAVDAAGDQALQTAVPSMAGQPLAVAARASHATGVQPSPIKGPAWWTAAGAPTGSGLIVATRLVGRLRLATWSP